MSKLLIVLLSGVFATAAMAQTTAPATTTGTRAGTSSTTTSPSTGTTSPTTTTAPTTGTTSSSTTTAPAAGTTSSSTTTTTTPSAGTTATAPATTASGTMSGMDPSKPCPPGLEKKDNGCMPPGLTRGMGASSSATTDDKGTQGQVDVQSGTTTSKPQSGKTTKDKRDTTQHTK